MYNFFLALWDNGKNIYKTTPCETANALGGTIFYGNVLFLRPAELANYFIRAVRLAGQ